MTAIDVKVCKNCKEDIGFSTFIIYCEVGDIQINPEEGEKVYGDTGVLCSPMCPHEYVYNNKLTDEERKELTMITD